MTQTFQGFEPANTTPVPDILFDELLSDLSGAELKVLLYIIRRTWGFKKQTDAISLSQLQHGIVTREGKRLDSGCGIKRRDTICDCLSSLEKKGCITTRKEKTSKNDNATTIYGIHFKSQEVVTKPDYPSHQTGLPVVSKPDYGGHKSELPVVTKPDPQETVIQEGTYGDDANAHHATPTHIDEQQVNGVSYSPDATRNAQNGDTHDNLPPVPHGDDHRIDARSVSGPSALSEGGSPTGQDLQAISNDENHSHEETHDNGLFDTTPSGTVVAGRDTGDQDADRSGSSQGSGPDTRRLPVANSTASGGVGCGVRAKTGTQASRAAAAGAGGSANRRDVGGEVTTPSLSVENSKPVGKGNKATAKGKKATEPLTEADLLAQVSHEVVAVIVEWQGIFKKHVPVTPALIEQAAALVAWQPETGEIVRCRLWMYETDTKNWYRTHGMNLGHVVRDFERFRSLACVPQSPPSHQKGVTAANVPHPAIRSSVPTVADLRAPIW